MDIVKKAIQLSVSPSVTLNYQDKKIKCSFIKPNIPDPYVIFLIGYMDIYGTNSAFVQIGAVVRPNSLKMLDYTYMGTYQVAKDEFGDVYILNNFVDMVGVSLPSISRKLYPDNINGSQDKSIEFKKYR